MKMDLNFLAEGDYPQLVPFRISGTCEGVRALAQKMIIMTLTDGNEPLRFGKGGGYVRLVGTTNANSPEMRNRMVLALASAVDVLKSEQTGDPLLTDDEKLSGASLIAFSQVGDSVDATISVTSVSGEIAQATLNTGAGA